MITKRLARCGIPFVCTILLSGCATYYNHYGSFTAENSAGELREYLVTWQTADYPDWWFQEDRSTAVTLKTQCSEREIRFVDATLQTDLSCGSDRHGIAWCGTKNVDVVAEVVDANAKEPCGWIQSRDAKRIVDLGNELELFMRCRPVQTTIGTGDDRKNVDYLKASVAPYWVSVKKVVRGSLDDRPPRFNAKICKQDGN